jgi:hypothetical protein
MNTKVPDFQTKKLVKPITWSNFPIWALKTVKQDLRTYQRKNRPISIHRLWRMLMPNLEQPIFIVGSARSGTTFLGSCFRALPEISYHFEPNLTKGAARYFYEGRWGIDKAKWFYRTLYGSLMRLHFDADLRLAEKTPRNSFTIPFLLAAFPDAKFVHIIRDGRDVAVSLSKKPWHRADAAVSGAIEPGGYPHGPYAHFWVEPERVDEFETTSDIHRCIWLWRRYVETVLEVASNLPDNQYHELRYEDLVFNTANETDRLLDFLEIFDPKSRYLFHQATAEVKPDSVGQWKRELLDDQLRQIDKEAGDLLRELKFAE